MIRLLVILLLSVSCKGNAETLKTQAKSYQIQVKEVKLDTLIFGIQSKIEKAFIQSLASKNDNSLSKLSDELEELNKVRKQSIILYWRAYLQFYSSIYYMENGDKKTAEKEIDKGIDWLKEMKNKNSEDYALLAMLQGFGIQFKMVEAPFIDTSARRNLKRAIAIDSTNLRAYSVFASHDFYTPKQFGGGKKTEEYSLKAISLPNQKIKNEYLPSWGKEGSYEILIRHYIREKKWSLAKKYFQEGVEKFPKSHIINQLVSKLIVK